MPLLWLSSAFLAGLCLADLLSLPWPVWAGLSGACLAGSFLEKRLSPPDWLLAFRRFSHLTVSLILAALLAGAAWYQLRQPVFDPGDLAYYNGSQVRLTGMIVDYADVRDNAVQITVQAGEMEIDGQNLPVKGKVLVRLPAGSEWQYGDWLYLNGKLTAPAENEEFSYRDYLAVRRIYSTLYFPYVEFLEHRSGSPLKVGIFRLRSAANRTLQTIFPQPEAALMSGILLGLEHDIPADLEEAFQTTGTSHIIAISGFNIAILAGLFFKASSRLLPRLWAPLGAILAIILYTVLVGGQASVVRAAVMGSMALIGRQIGRENTGINSLAFTGAVMCFFNPLLLHDAGFQLSFAATLGLVLYAERWQAALLTRLERHFSPTTARRWSGWLSDYLLFTLAAQLTTLPLILYHFGRLSFSSLLANVLILPVQPLVMILGGVALLGGLAWLPLGKLLGYVTWALPAYTNRMVQLLAGISGGSLQSGAIPLWLPVVFYLILAAFSLEAALAKYLPKVSDLSKQVRPTAVLAALTLVCVALWNSAALLPDGRLHVDVINVPDGPVVWVQMPAGETLLINGSSSASRLNSELGQRMPWSRRRLDAMLVTQGKSKPLAGLPAVLEQFPAGMLLWNEQAAGLRNGELIAESLRDTGVEPLWLQTGQTVSVDQGPVVRVLQHSSSGTALLIAWQNFSLLIPGGVPLGTLDHQDLAGLDALLLGEADVVSTPPAEWDALAPVLVIWQGAGSADLPADDPRWVHLDDYAHIEVVTDGLSMQASVGD